MAERAAVGGDAWNGVAAIEEKGTVTMGGSSGSFSDVVDHRTGYSRTAMDMASLHHVSGFDGAAWEQENGILTVADLPSLVADAEAEAFVNRDGWWGVPNPFKAKLLPAQADSPGDTVEITPVKGSGFAVSFDRATHLYTRITAHADDGDQVTVYSDWRTVDGVRFPFKQVQTDPTGAVTTVELSSVKLDKHLPFGALARPSRKVQGFLQAGAPTTVPFRLTGDDRGHIVVSATVDGKSSNLIFDSGGADYLVPDAARRLGLTVGGGVNVEGVGEGSENAGLAEVGSISLGEARLQKEAVIVGPLPYPAIHPRAGMVTDGLVGFEFLSEFRTTLDYAKRTLTFSRFGDKEKAEGITLPFVTDGQHFYIEAAVDGARGLFMVDTGDSGGVTVLRTFADAHGLFTAGGTVAESVGGIGGKVSSRKFTDETFALAGITFSHVPLSVSQAHAGAFASRSIAGNLGSGVLRRFTITFDYQAHTVTLAPNEHAKEPFHQDWAGLGTDQVDARAFKVLSVETGLAAQEAGLAPGDTILAVNGTSIAEQHLGLADLGVLLRKDKPVELTVQRKDQTRKVVLMPKRS